MDANTQLAQETRRHERRAITATVLRVSMVVIPLIIAGGIAAWTITERGPLSDGAVVGGRVKTLHAPESDTASHTALVVELDSGKIVRVRSSATVPAVADTRVRLQERVDASGRPQRYTLIGLE